MKVKSNSILLFAIVLSGILIVSCQKEQSPNGKNEIPANDLKLAYMIKNFKAKGESGLKNTAEMSVDSAIWYIGATANFTYGDASRETERTWTDSIFISLPINNGKITESEVFTKYEQVIDSLRAIYQAKNEENKQLLAVGVETHSLSSTALVCKVTGVFAYGLLSNNTPCIFNDINSYCFWYSWQNQAICAGPNTTSTVITDAAEETQKRIMWCKGVPSGNYWYEPIITVPISDPTLYPVIPGATISNNRYAKLYWNSSQYPNFNGCIPPADLNFYLTKTKELINTETTQGGLRQPGYSLIDIDMWGESHLQNSFTIYQHQANVRYGVLHVSIDPPISL